MKNTIFCGGSVHNVTTKQASIKSRITKSQMSLKLKIYVNGSWNFNEQQTTITKISYFLMKCKFSSFYTIFWFLHRAQRNFIVIDIASTLATTVSALMFHNHWGKRHFSSKYGCGGGISGSGISIFTWTPNTHTFLKWPIRVAFQLWHSFGILKC